MSHLLKLVTELALLTLCLGYRDGANNYFNDWFLLNNELIQPCRKIIFEVEFVYSKEICFYNKLLRSGSLGLYFIMDLTFLLTWFFWLVGFFWNMCKMFNYRWFIVSSNKVFFILYWTGIKFFISIANASQMSKIRLRCNAIPRGILLRLFLG